MNTSINLHVISVISRSVHDMRLFQNVKMGGGSPNVGEGNKDRRGDFLLTDPVPVRNLVSFPPSRANRFVSERTAGNVLREASCKRQREVSEQEIEYIQRSDLNLGRSRHSL